MAKRYLTTKILHSSKFLRMSDSEQLLYCHLVVNADDEGVVEAFGVAGLAAISRVALFTLEKKGFITILDGKDGIAYINKWDTFNKISPSKLKKSEYHELLQEHLKTVEE